MQRQLFQRNRSTHSERLSHNQPNPEGHWTFWVHPTLEGTLMNWYGLFTMLFVTHLIAMVLAFVAGYEHAVDQMVERDSQMKNHPCMGGRMGQKGE